VICALHQISSGLSNGGKFDGRGVWHAWGETNTGKVLMRKPAIKKHWKRREIRWKDNITMYLKETRKYAAILFQAWRGLEGSRRLRLPDFKTVGT